MSEQDPPTVPPSDEDRFTKSYLGDSVYASFDGYHLVLRTSNGIMVSNEILLEPEVYTKFVRYATLINKCCEFAPGDAVRYVPGHAHGDSDHADCEDGKVSSQNGFCVFVKFNKQVANIGWEGTTAQNCDPYSLVKL